MKCPICDTNNRNDSSYCINCSWRFKIFASQPDDINSPYIVAMKKAKENWNKLISIEAEIKNMTREILKLNEELKSEKSRLKQEKNKYETELKNLKAAFKQSQSQQRASDKEKFAGIRKEYEDKIQELKRALVQYDNLITKGRSRDRSKSSRNNGSEFIFQEIEKQLGLHWCTVPSGEFIMGDENDNENPPRRVRISRPFKISKFPITVAQWHEVMGNDHLPNPRKFRSPDHPKVNISWDDINDFLIELNSKVLSDPIEAPIYRLPTEAEWEFAAREADPNNRFDYSGSFVLADVGWFEENSDIKLRTVNDPGIQANQLGIMGMSGNIDEWCRDSWEDLKLSNDLITDPTGGPESEYKVIRGGNYASNESACKVFRRRSALKGERSFDLGFRLVCELVGKRS